MTVRQTNWGNKNMWLAMLLGSFVVLIVELMVMSILDVRKYFRSLKEMSSSNIGAPLNPLMGQLWYDQCYKSLKIFDGNAWSIVYIRNSSDIESITQSITPEQTKIDCMKHV